MEARVTQPWRRIVLACDRCPKKCNIIGCAGCVSHIFQGGFPVVTTQVQAVRKGNQSQLAKHSNEFVGTLPYKRSSRGKAKYNSIGLYWLSTRVYIPCLTTKCSAKHTVEQ